MVESSSNSVKPAENELWVTVHWDNEENTYQAMPEKQLVYNRGSASLETVLGVQIPIFYGRKIDYGKPIAKGSRVDMLKKVDDIIDGLEDSSLENDDSIAITPPSTQQKRPTKRPTYLECDYVTNFTNKEEISKENNQRRVNKKKAEGNPVNLQKPAKQQALTANSARKVNNIVTRMKDQNIPAPDKQPVVTKIVDIYTRKNNVWEHQPIDDQQNSQNQNDDGYQSQRSSQSEELDRCLLSNDHLEDEDYNFEVEESTRDDHAGFGEEELVSQGVHSPTTSSSSGPSPLSALASGPLPSSSSGDGNNFQNDETSSLPDEKDKKIRQLLVALRTAKTTNKSLERELQQNRLKDAANSEMLDLKEGVLVPKAIIDEIFDKFGHLAPALILRHLMLGTRLFTREDIANCSVTGKKSRFDIATKPGLGGKFQALKGYVIERCGIQTSTKDLKLMNVSIRSICTDIRKSVKRGACRAALTPDPSTGVTDNV